MLSIYVFIELNVFIEINILELFNRLFNELFISYLSHPTDYSFAGTARCCHCVTVDHAPLLCILVLEKGGFESGTRAANCCQLRSYYYQDGTRKAMLGQQYLSASLFHEYTIRWTRLGGDGWTIAPAVWR